MALPLKGLRVVDLTKDFAGPFCTMILSDLGAEVIKIEKPGTGDETRAWGPPFVDGQSYYFLSLNRGKKSVTLDLKTATAQKIIRGLVQDSDILVESFRPGTLTRYHLDYPSLRRVNKALVYCSISGFGQTGPYRDRPGYDITAYAMSGIMSTTGEKGRPPIRVSGPVADIAAGHYASSAILACLSRRLVTGRQPPRMGSAHPSIVPYQAFNCKDRELIVAVGNDAQWQALCHALGLKQLANLKEFSTNPQRVSNRQALIPILSRRLKSRKASYWNRLFNKSGVPAAPILSIADVVRDPQIRHRGVFKPSKSAIPTLTSPITFTKQDNRIPSLAPRLGQDTRRVLRGLGQDLE